MLQQLTSIMRHMAIGLIFKIGAAGGWRVGGVHGFGDLCFLVLYCVFGVQVAHQLVVLKESDIGLTGFQIKKPTYVGFSIKESSIFSFKNITSYIRRA